MKKIVIFIGIVLSLFLAINLIKKSPKTIDQDKTMIVCNYGNKKSFTAKESGIEFDESDFKEAYLPNEKREKLQKLCDISVDELNIKLDEIFENKDNNQNLFDVDPAYK